MRRSPRKPPRGLGLGSPSPFLTIKNPPAVLPAGGFVVPSSFSAPSGEGSSVWCGLLPSPTRAPETGGCLYAHLLRLRDDAKLLQRAQVVVAPPDLLDAAVLQAVDVDPLEGDRSARGRDAVEFAGLSAVHGEPLDHAISVGQERVDGGVHVGKTGAEHPPRFLEALEIARCGVSRIVID